MIKKENFIINYIWIHFILFVLFGLLQLSLFLWPLFNFTVVENYVIKLFPINYIFNRIFWGIYSWIISYSFNTQVVGYILILLFGVIGYIYLLKKCKANILEKILIVATALTIMSFLYDIIFLYFGSEFSRIGYLMLFGYSQFVGLFVNSILLFILIKTKFKRR